MAEALASGQPVERPKLIGGVRANLRCRDGHWRYSHAPDAFAGMPCESGNKPGNCRAPLDVIRSPALPRTSGKVAGVNGLTTPGQEAAAIA